MAEFKLGRIRFIWKGAWVTGTTYVKDDVVRQGGKVFLCVTGHTAAADFTTDLTASRWQLTADGSAWTGNWATSTYYKLNDIVKYGGTLYICNTTHTSAASTALGLENDSAKWDVFASSFNWIGNWATSTRYKAKDVVKYGGESYICNTGHTSAASTALGLENDQSKWDIYAEGLLWTTDWLPNTRYRVNDVVRNGGILYVANVGHTSAASWTSGLENDQSKWDYLHKGFSYTGSWTGPTTVTGTISGSVLTSSAGSPAIGQVLTGGSIAANTIILSGSGTTWNLSTSNGTIGSATYTATPRYKVNDVVRYGADLFLCTTNHTASSTFSTSNFVKFIEGLQYFNTWVSGTTYAPGALVTYGGFVYEAILVTSGTTAPSLDATNWILFTSGFTYIGVWSNATAYKVGNVVTVGGYSYVAIADGTGQNPATQTAYWSKLNNGFKWNATAQSFNGTSGTNVVYTQFTGNVAPGTAVTFTASTSGSTLTVTTAPTGLGIVVGAVLSGGTVPAGTYILANLTGTATSASSTWTLSASITAQGSQTLTTTPIVLTANVPTAGTIAVNQVITGGTLTAGTKITGLGSGTGGAGTYYVTPTQTVTGSPTITSQGTTATFNINTSGTSYTVAVANAGTNYAVGHTIKVLGTAIGGITTFNDLVITVATVNSSGAIQTVTSAGIATTWASGTVYVLGDVVFYGPSSYTCILGHTASGGNSPANDTSGTYWNIMAAGTSTAVLTTAGDMVYYSGSGPTRLPIGTTGQVLTVSAGGLPNWTYWGVVNQVYYVATGTGTNSPAPAYGLSLDRPWASVRYASYQIEAGTQLPNAVNMLQRNRSYIQKETIAWINYQVTNNISPFSTGFTYDQTKCERDIGLVIDALAWDLSHGGNVKSRQAALAYVNALTGSNPSTTGTYSLLSAQSGQDVASYNQMVVVINAVINNTAPGTTYQGTVTRVADATKTLETGTTTLVANLVKVITDAITAQVSTNIPVEVKPNYTINVKTGIYYETLPIIVPENTAVVGDELRSTNIRPAPAGTVYAYDTTYSLGAITRIKNIISNVVQNTTGNATLTGPVPNAVSQVTTRPASNSTVGTAAATILQNYIDYVNFYVNASGSAPTLAGTNTPITTQVYYDAVAILEENKSFLTAEAVAYAGLTYSGTATATAAGSPNITVSSTTPFAINERVTFSGTTFGGINTTGTIYYITAVNSGSSYITVALTQGGSPLTWSLGSGTLTVQLYYPLAVCQRDVQFIIDALKYDLVFTGNYKTLQAAAWYANGVNGSITKDMFYVRNGSGIRNATLQGLTGTLSAANGFGTKRPTAGAYVSLDPGWGPNDSRVWIATRSPYTQNITMFGTGCVGGKIDGTLHNGGNRSIVANDFTTVLSDGIGVWCTGPNALTEQVSTFSYYGYAGYLAEAGGKIRATNGNSSYGTYGVIAEGVDSTETPLTATINNRAYQAQITNVLTDAVNYIWRFEYSNAGQGYNTGTYSIGGTGYGAVAVADEFRDQGVFETRNITAAYSSTIPTTPNFVSVANTGQGGSSIGVQLSATDLAVNNAYQGMRVVLTGGTGAGQQAYIVDFNSGTKLARVAKESVPTITATQTITSTFTGTGFINGTILTVTSTSAGSPAAGQILVGTGVITNNYITSTNTASFTGAVALGTAVTFTGSIAGTTLTVTSAPTGTGIIAGYVLSGGSIPSGAYVTGNLTGTATSTSSTWTVNQTITQSSITITATPVVLTASAVTGNISIGQALTGTGWTAGSYVTGLGTGTSGAGTYYVSPSQTVASIATTGTSYNVSVTNGINTVAVGTSLTGTQNSILIPSTASLYTGMPLYMTGTTIGGLLTATPYYVLAAGFLSDRFSIGLSAGATPVTVTNQTASTMIINAAGFDHAVPGTTIASTLDVTTNYLVEPRLSFTGPGYTATPTTQQNNTWIDAVYGNINATYTTVSATGGAGAGATFTVVRTGTAYAVTLAGIGSAYVQGNTLTIAGTSLGGLSPANSITITVTLVSTSGTAGQILNFTYTGTGAGGYFLAIPSSGTATQYSLNGTTWTSGGNLSTLSTGTYSAIAYGNGRWVAINKGGQVTSYSTNGTSWSAGGNLPTSSSWTAITYGNPGTGYFVAVASGTNSVAYSTDATSWINAAGGLPATATWFGVAYGAGKFVAIAGGTVASNVAAYSVDGITWLSATLPAVSLWTSVTYGRGKFVAIAEATNQVAYSNNGTTWSLSPSGLPVTQTWTSVRYGQGLFMAAASSLAPTITATTVGTNLVTLSSTTGLAVGETLVPASITQTPTASATTIATATMLTTSISNTTLSIGSVSAGTVAVGMVLTGTNVISGTYIVSGGGLSWTVSINHSVSTGSQTITGTNNTITVSNTTGLSVGQSFVPTAVQQVSTLTSTTSAGVALNVVSTAGMLAGEPIVFAVAGTQTPNLVATTTGTNLAQLSSTAGISVGNSIIFTAATQTPYVLTTQTTGNLISLSSSTGLAVNQSISFTAVTQTPTLQQTFASNNQIQVSSLAGLTVGQQIQFTSVTQTPTAATATTTANATSTASTILGNTLTVGGTASGWAVGTVLSGTGVQTFQNITVTGATGTGTSAILSFASQTVTPFINGQTITVTGMIPTGYNGTYTVTAASQTSVTYANATTAAMTQAGSVNSLPTYITALGSGSGGTGSYSLNIIHVTIGAGQTINGRLDSITLGSTAGMSVGEPIVFSGTAFGGLTNAQTTYITEIISATQLSVTTSYISGPGAVTNLALSTATGSMTVVAGGSAGGVAAATPYWITSLQPTGNLIQIATSYGGSAISLSNSVATWTGVAGGSFGTYPAGSTTYYIQAVTTGSATTTGSTIGLAGTAGATAGYVLTIGTATGTIAVGQLVTGGSIAAGTYISANISGSGNGSTWYVNISQAITSTATTHASNTITIGLAPGSGALTLSTSGSGNWASVAGSVFGNLTSGTTYYVASVSSPNVTLSSSPTLSPIVALANGAGTWASVAGSAIGGLQPGLPYYILSNGSNVLTVSTTYNGSPFTVTNGVGAWTATAGGQWDRASASTGFIGSGTGPSGIGSSSATGLIFTPTGTVAGTFAAGMVLGGTGVPFANPTTIQTVNTGTIVSGTIASTAYSTTGTVGSISGTGPWTATITGMSATAGFTIGAQITATNGSPGNLFGGSPTSVVVTSIAGSTSITYTVTGGTTPVAGAITNISQTVLTAAASSTGLAQGQLLSGGSVTANSYIVGQLTSTGSALATGVVSGVFNTNVLTFASFSVGSMATLAVGQFVGQITGIPANSYITAVNTLQNQITISQNLYVAVSGTTSTYAAGGPGTYAITNQANTATTGTPTTGTSYTINSTNAVLTTATAITGYATSGAGYNAGGLTTTGTYYILTIPTSGAGGTITVGTSYGANPASWTSTTAGLSWTTVAGSVFGNLSSGTTYYISSINSNQVTLSTSATLTPTVTLTTQGGTWNSVAGATNIAATSEDGLYWTSRTLSTSGSWPIAVFGNPNNNPVWVALTSGTTVANSIATGATTQARAKIVSGTITEIRMIEPGSGYATAPTPSLLDPNVSLTPFTNSVTPTAVANANGTITVPSGNYAVGQAVIVSGTNTGTAGASFITGYTTGTTYYVMTGGTAVTSIRLTDTYANAVAGTGNLTATVGTLVGITFTINFVVRTATGVMANPSFTNRGLLYATATGSVATGNGFADIYQSSAYVNISNIYTVPTAGSNITLSNGDGTYYKLVVVNNLVYSSGSNLPYTATFQVSPPFTSLTAPAHGTTLTMRIKYSQVRLTGHDFLNIGTGNQTSTNYPGTPAIAPDSTKQTAQFGGGRTFFTSTDQDGNFNVGNLFTVVQSTGVATLNANAFNLAGLNSLSLGSVALGTGSAIITSFSTDPYFTANSDNVVPTQKATKSYISSQIGGGGSSLNVNTLTAGIVYIFNNQISTTNGNQINVSNKLYFVGAGGIDGVPLAMNFLLS